jgi:hypothetical protein
LFQLDNLAIIKYKNKWGTSYVWFPIYFYTTQALNVLLKRSYKGY